MTAPDLRTLIGLAGQPDAPLDVAALAGRLRRRRRRRRAAQAGATLMLLAVVLLSGQAIRGGQDVLQVDLAARQATLVAVDPDIDVAAGVPPLPTGARAHEPTRLPDGYRRCSAPQDVGALSVTHYCAEGRADLSLSRGPHVALPEVGQRVQVAERIGYLQRQDGQVVMTVSDDNGPDDRHHRLQVLGDTDLAAGDLAAILTSVPAIAQAPPPSTGGR